MANPTTLYEEAERLLDAKAINEALEVLNKIGESILQNYSSPTFNSN